MPRLTRRSILAGASLALPIAGCATLPAKLPASPADAPLAVTPPGMILGEGPLWSARDNALYWVDIRGKKLFRLAFADNRQSSWDMPDMIPWIVERKSGGFLVAIRRTIHALTLDPFTLTPLFEVEADKPGNRLNDAKVDAKGRLWTGSMDNAFKDRTAALYRIDPDLSVHQMDTGYVCANGPAFSKDGKVLYHNETHDRIVYAFDLADDGSLANKRVFATIAPEDGRPDGCTVDAENGLWVSHYDGGRATRFLADGAVDFVLKVPARQSTSLTFAGPGLDRMFNTTAAQPPVGADDPQAGTLFEMPKSWLRGHTGLPTPAFAG